MAKTTKPKAPTKAELEAEVVVEAIEIIPVNEQTALEKFVPFDEQLKSLIAEVDSMPPITDKASLAHAEALSKKIRKFEIAVDKTRLASTKPIRDMLDSLKGHCDGMIKTAEGKRGTVDNAINAEAIRLQEEAQREHERRIDLLNANGWMLNGQFYTCGVHRILFDQVDTATEDQLQQWAAIGQQEIARVAAEKAAEEARKAQLETRAAELARRESELAAKLARLEELERLHTERQAAAQVPAGGYSPTTDNTNPLPPQESGTTDFPIQQTPPQPIPSLFPAEQPAPAQPAPQQQMPWQQQGTAPQNPPVTTSAPQFNPAQAPIEVPENIPAAQFDNGGQLPAFGNEAGNSALMELAKLRNTSVSFLLSQPEAKVHWNMAIDHIHRIFTTSTEQLTKDQWAKVFLNHKR